MNAFQAYLHNFFFNIYPYVCLAVFFMGSLARFDRDQYTWKSDSSQLLRSGTLRWGSGGAFSSGAKRLEFGERVHSPRDDTSSRFVAFRPRPRARSGRAIAPA